MGFHIFIYNLSFQKTVINTKAVLFCKQFSAELLMLVFLTYFTLEYKTFLTVLLEPHENEGTGKKIFSKFMIAVIYVTDVCFIEL